MATNFEVAHSWAHGLDKCTQSPNMYHYNGRLYSYRTCIAQKLKFKDKDVFIFDDARFSSTTSKHQSDARQAIPRENAEIFYFTGGTWGRYAIIDNDYCNKKDVQHFYHRSLIHFGLQYIAQDLLACLNVRTCKVLDHGFSGAGFSQAKRWFDVTGCIKLSSICRMTVQKFMELLPHSFGCLIELKNKKNAHRLLKFIKMMCSKTPLTEIVDKINGKNCWKKYQERISPLIKAQKSRRLSRFLKFDTPNTRWCDRIYNKYIPVVKGGVSTKDIVKHTKSGDLITWMLELKKNNINAAIETYEKDARFKRYDEAKKRLEKALGMRGFKCYCWNKHAVTQFDYNGVVMDLRHHWFGERNLTGDEYKEFAALSAEEKKQWMVEKKQWMLQQLQADQLEYDTRAERQQRELEEAARQCEEERQREEANKDYIADMKAKGDEGVRQLWHEGFNVSIYNKNISFFHGGNALLRVYRGVVETSKGIKVSIDECRRLWNLISRWHKNSAEFEAGEFVKSTMHNWTIERFQGNIMIAGCHAIHYSEMERVANELGFDTI